MNHSWKTFSRLWSTLVVLFFSLSGGSARAQVQITANQTAATLAQRLAGPGVVITNPTLTCANGANGRFTVTSSNLGLDSGIVLSTGLVLNINDQEAGLTSTNNNTPGDPALQALSGASTTRDACILEFDITPKEDLVKFEYVFASEEYINSVCGPYNDAFAFFISGPSISGTVNMARVPNTTIPVTVNSINNGIPGQLAGGSLANCTSMGAGAPFTQYYVNNQGGATIAYRGFTTVLTAQNAVTPCQTYHLKMTVADAQNSLYDSGVFIKAGSLQSTSYAVTAQGPAPQPATPFIAKGCAPGSVTFSRSIAKPTPQVLQVQTSGTAVSGTDYAPLPATVTIPANATQVTIPVTALAAAPAGTRLLKVGVFAPNNCNGAPELADSALLDIVDAPQVAVLTPDTTLCSGTSLPLQVSGAGNLSYSWSPATALSNPGAKDPVASPQQTTSYTVTASLVNSGCTPVSDGITINVIAAPQFVDAGPEVNTCVNTAVQFTGSAQPSTAAFQYQWSGPGGYSASGPDPLIASAQTSQSGWYFLSVSAPGCAALTDSVLVNVVTSPPVPAVVTPVAFCVGENKALQATGAGLRWYSEAHGGSGTSQVPQVNSSYEHTEEFYVSQSYGSCESERVKITAVVARCCGDNVFIPNAFTPNGDGLNDVFGITLDQNSTLVQMEIFNRWGQKVFQQPHGSRGWDGTFNGQMLQPGSYYYNIVISCRDGRMIYKKGDVTLIR